MQIKKNYDGSLFGNIHPESRKMESLVREILGKMCPLHGVHATIKIKKGNGLTIIACCEEFHKLIHKIIYDFQAKS